VRAGGIVLELTQVGDRPGQDRFRHELALPDLKDFVCPAGTVRASEGQASEGRRGPRQTRQARLDRPVTDLEVLRKREYPTNRDYTRRLPPEPRWEAPERPSPRLVG
jgi:hypothetical protein